MAVSYWVLANVIAELLETRPLYVWGFFFGLVAAAVIQIGTSITWQVLTILTGIFGFLVGAFLVLELDFYYRAILKILYLN